MDQWMSLQQGISHTVELELSGPMDVSPASGFSYSRTGIELTDEVPATSDSFSYFGKKLSNPWSYPPMEDCLL